MPDRLRSFLLSVQPFPVQPLPVQPFPVQPFPVQPLLVQPLLLVLCLCVLAGPAGAQTIPVGDERADYLRLLEATGKSGPLGLGVSPLSVWRAYDAVGDTTRHPWRDWFERPRSWTLGEGATLTLADPGLRSTFNTDTPYGQNEGALWSGSGLNLALDGGATLRWRALEVTLHPTLTWSQNRDFDMQTVFFEEVPEFGYPWRRIDLPQRFGPDPVTRLDLGQSAVRLHLGPAQVGVTTESLWWGPAIRNPTVMSNNAPGFPHGYLATSQPVGVGIGDVHARWIFGRLSQSDWFEIGSEDPGRYLTGAVATFQPHIFRGLTLGVSRVFYAVVPEDGIPASEAFLVFQGVRKERMATPENPTGDDLRSQMFSAFWRWVLPESNTEVWGEWTRNDHGWNIRDYIRQPEQGSALTLGLRHAVELSGDRLLAVETEVTRLEQPRTIIVRDSPTFYAHSVVLQGYTNEGQIIGAAIGPGGSAQELALNLYSPGGRSGVFVRRRVRDNDAYYYEQMLTGERNFSRHNVLLDFGAGALRHLAGWEVDAASTLTWETNRYFRPGDSVDWSLNLALSARWRGR